MWWSPLDSVVLAEKAAPYCWRFHDRLTSDALEALTILALPHGQRAAPETLAADGPVDVVFEPTSEAAVADVLARYVGDLARAQPPKRVSGG